MTDLVQVFKECWDEAVADRREKSPSFQPSDYVATGRAAAAYGGKRTEKWWLDNGPAMVEKYIAWRKSSGWAILDVNGTPAVELELNFPLPGVDMLVKGFIDRIFVTAAGEPVIVDIKTGRTPETPEQLGLYRVGMQEVHGISIDWGGFWSPDKGFGGFIDLRPWTAERFGVLFSQAVAGINAGAFLPNPANNCKSWCGVAHACAVVGGADAARYDSLST